MLNNFIKIIIKKNIRIYLSDLTDVVNEILNYHKYLPFPNLILANAIVSFTPLIYLYETKNLLVRLKTNGAIKSLILESKNESVRALITNPNIETEYDKKNYNKIPLILGIGDDGIIEISRKVNNEYFNSQTQLVKFDIVTDLAYFLNKSDQIYSAVINDVELNDKNHNVVNKARNIIFQLLPNHTEEDKIWIGNFIKDNNLKNLSLKDVEKIIDGKILETKKINGSCWCNKEKIISSINLIKNSEKEELFLENKTIEVVCEFCLKKYLILKEDILN